MQDGFAARSSVFHWDALGVSVRGREQTHWGLQGGKRPSALPPCPHLVLKSKMLLGGLVPGRGPLLGDAWLGCLLCAGALHLQGVLCKRIQSGL